MAPHFFFTDPTGIMKRERLPARCIAMMSMFFALLAIALMFIANFLIITARRREKGWVRTLLSICAFLLLPPIFFFALIALL